MAIAKNVSKITEFINGMPYVDEAVISLRRNRVHWMAVALLLGLATAQSVVTKDSPSQIPEEVKYKEGYVNAVRPPAGFNSAMLWGIAIADSRVSGYGSAEVEIASTRLTCRVGGQEVVLNDDPGSLRGGLYRRFPWFGSDEHSPLPMEYDSSDGAVILAVGRDVNHVWHFWSASPRASFPPGKLEGCTVKMRTKISRGALLQVGFDYWRNATTGYGPGGNNHEAGASGWYFSSPAWQEASFSDIGMF